MTRHKTTELVTSLGISAFMFLVSILTAIYGIWPGIEKIKSNYDETQSLKAENASIQKKITFLSNLDDTALSGQVETLLSAVPQTKSIQSAFATLESVAGQTGINLQGISVDTPGSLSTASAAPMNAEANKLGSNMLKLKVQAVGTMDQINNFMDTIIKVRRLMRISNISLTFAQSSAATSSPSAIVSSDFSVDAFYAALPKTLGKAEAELTPLTANDEEFISKISGYSLVLPATTPAPQLPPKADPFAP
jgi:hypothetical protein